MSSVLSDLKKKASQLSEQERAELALSLIESLDGPSDPDVEQAWRKEIERRVGQVERGEVQLIPVKRSLPESAVDSGDHAFVSPGSRDRI
jgi:putative addiction module component (TIGR02574 family)